MRSLTWAIAPMLAAALVTGCGPESGPTAENAPALTSQAAKITDHVSSITPLDEIFFNSPCNGEDIHMIGTLSVEDNFVGTDEFFPHHELQVVVSETGTGLATGATYRSHDVNHEGFNSPTVWRPTSSSPTMRHTTSSARLRGCPSRGQSFFNFVSLPSGDFKVTRDVGSLECRV